VCKVLIYLLQVKSRDCLVERLPGPQSLRDSVARGGVSRQENLPTTIDVGMRISLGEPRPTILGAATAWETGTARASSSARF
jgi:hypothetical protein